MAKSLSSLMDGLPSTSAQKSTQTAEPEKNLPEPPQAQSAKKRVQKKPPEPKVQEKEVMLQVTVPESVRRAVDIASVQEGITRRMFVLRALKKNGIEVDNTLIVDRRK